LPPQIVKKEKPEEAFIKVATNELPEAVIRKVISAYIVGYNVLHLKSQNQQQLSTKLRNQLKNFARNYLVGTEIVTDTPIDLTLQVLLNYPELSVKSALSRMAVIAVSMHKESIAALKNLDYLTAKAVIETDREVNRFGLYIIRLLKMAISNPRIIKEVGLDNPRNCLGYRLIAKAVERTADHATKISENVLLL
ncbi:MAG: PhoU domain-containing protein, partial [Candidatus Bathyarchaeia archaeon]